MKEMIVLNKRRGKKIIIFVLIIIFIYYIYVLIETNGVMKMAKKVAAGEVTVESGTPYARFRPLGENIYTCNVTRYFAYCGMEKGKIYVTCVNVVKNDDGTESKGRDWFVILIEKTEDGTWEAVGTVGKP